MVVECTQKWIKVGRSGEFSRKGVDVHVHG